jgi:hypothetical protein
MSSLDRTHMCTHWVPFLAKYTLTYFLRFGDPVSNRRGRTQETEKNFNHTRKKSSFPSRHISSILSASCSCFWGSLELNFDEHMTTARTDGRRPKKGRTQLKNRKSCPRRPVGIIREGNVYSSSSWPECFCRSTSTWLHTVISSGRK